MNLIMNEKEYIENIIDTKKVPKDISNRYLIKMLIRYYRDKEKDLVKYILEFSKELQFENDSYRYEEYKFFNNIKKYLKEENLKPIDLKEIKYIPLLQEELDVINSLTKDREKKFLFVCYIMARFNNSDWINIDDKELFKMANISLTCNDRQLFIYNMIQKGYMSQAKSNTNNSINIKRLGGEEIIKVIDFNNMGNFLLSYLKPNYTQCTNCGKLIKIKSKFDSSTKYCDSCAREIFNEQCKENMRKMRERQKEA
jgi:hypothetical protein